MDPVTAEVLSAVLWFILGGLFTGVLGVCSLGLASYLNKSWVLVTGWILTAAWQVFVLVRVIVDIIQAIGAAVS